MSRSFLWSSKHTFTTVCITVDGFRHDSVDEIKFLASLSMSSPLLFYFLFRRAAQLLGFPFFCLVCAEFNKEVSRLYYGGKVFGDI